MDVPIDLHELPRLEDSISYLYIDKAVIERDMNSIIVLRENERIPVPVSALTVLMLGPGTRATHAAIQVLAENGCLVVWCGEGAMRFYGYGMGETRSSANLLRQAEYCMNEEKHLLVVRRMYQMRFPEIELDGKTIQQMRGMEGVRVRETYKLLAKKFGLYWGKRSYNAEEWDSTDDLNKAFSAGNTCLYGLCNAAIVSLGYSSGLGFIHTGKMLSFVYDIADLYKMETTLPVAFEIVTQISAEPIERAVRKRLRIVLKERRVLKRIAHDLKILFDAEDIVDVNQNNAGSLWNGGNSTIGGGKNHSGEEDDNNGNG